MSFEIKELDVGDMTGGDTGEFTMVDDNPAAGYGDIKDGEQDAIWSGERAESAPKNVV